MKNMMGFDKFFKSVAGRVVVYRLTLLYIILVLGFLAVVFDRISFGLVLADEFLSGSVDGISTWLSGSFVIYALQVSSLPLFVFSDGLTLAWFFISVLVFASILFYQG